MVSQANQSDVIGEGNFVLDPILHSERIDLGCQEIEIHRDRPSLYKAHPRESKGFSVWHIEIWPMVEIHHIEVRTQRELQIQRPFTFSFS